MWLNTVFFILWFFLLSWSGCQYINILCKNYKKELDYGFFGEVSLGWLVFLVISGCVYLTGFFDLNGSVTATLLVSVALRVYASMKMTGNLSRRIFQVQKIQFHLVNIHWIRLLSIALVSVVLFGIMFGNDFTDVPGIGNWGYKAKLILECDINNIDWWKRESVDRKVGYPPLYPYCLACLWAWKGDLPSSGVYLPNWIFTVLSMGIVVPHRSHSTKFSFLWISAVVVVFLSEPVRLMMHNLYAEPLLLLAAVMSIYSFRRFTISTKFSGVLFGIILSIPIICLSWTKMEGAMLAISGIIIFSRKIISLRGVYSFLFLVCSVCVWHVNAFFQGWRDQSYEKGEFIGKNFLHNEILLNKLWSTINALLKHILNFENGAWILVVVPIMFVCSVFQKKNISSWRCEFLVVCLSLMVVCVAIVRIAVSKEPLPWMLEVLPRIIVMPIVLLLNSSIGYFWTRNSPCEKSRYYTNFIDNLEE